MKYYKPQLWLAAGYDIAGYTLALIIFALSYLVHMMALGLPETQTTIFYILTVVVLAVTLVLFALNASFFKRKAYHVTCGKTYNWKEFFMQTLYWYIIWFIIYVIVIYSVEQQYLYQFLIGMIVIYTPLTANFRLKMTHKFKETAQNAIALVFTVRALVTYFFILALYFILVQIMSWTLGTLPDVFIGTSIIVTLLYITWARYYLYKRL